VITRRKLLTAMLLPLVISATATAGEWSETYRDQLKGEAERRRRVRQQRREAAQQRLAMQRWLANQRALRSSSDRDSKREKDEHDR
jgi:hypothetical protein